MIVYRLAKSQYSHDLSGRGAAKSGGRWNSKGTAILYTSQSRALCTAELAVHLPFGSIPKDYMMVSIAIPDNTQMEEITVMDLEEGWNEFPHKHFTQIIGDKFIISGKRLVLKVPSAVVNGDFNYLINPLHKDCAQVKIQEVSPFVFDKRLFLK